MLNLAKGEYLGKVKKSFSANGLLIGLTEYNGREIISELHSHSNAHMNFVLRGEMIVSRKRHSGMSTAAERFSYINSGEPHQTYLNSSFGKNIHLELESSFFEEYDLTENKLERLMNLPGSSMLMLRIYHELRFQGTSFSDNVHALFFETLADKNLIDGSLAPTWVSKVRELLRDNWDQEVSLQTVSRIAGVHPVTISKNFPRYFGYGLGEYRRRLKLERAMQMMSMHNCSLTDVAYACGFCDQSHFIRIFKSLAGFSPKSLRLF